MIPSQFDYKSPTTVDEALSLLGESPDAKLLAGGQSLIPVMKLRMADPELVIDLGRVASMRGVKMDGDTLVIGAMTDHHELATNELVARHAPMLGQAAASVADSQVRHRGTIGGSLVHADPAGDYPAPVLAMGGELVVTGASGTRTVAAADFFIDFFTTAVDEDDVLTEVRIPSFAGWGSDYQKFNRVAQQWSIVAAGAAVRMDGDRIGEARIGLTNMGPTAIRPSATERALAGRTASEVADACRSVADGTEPTSDLNGDEEYRKHLATVLTRRAVTAAMDNAG